MSTATQARPYVCPACDAEHGTLAALLTCHPRELRAITDRLAGDKGRSIGLRSVIGGHMTPATRRQVRLVLHPDAATGEVA